MKNRLERRENTLNHWRHTYMELHRAGTVRAGFLAFVFAGTGCGLILGLDDFEDASPQGSQSSGGSSATDACRPEASESCYGGPPGTEDVGLCRSGTRTCDNSGEMWGACQGEVLPQQESCSSTEDENCDGHDCALWARTAETLDSKARISSVVVDKQDNTISAGSFTGSIPFGAEPLAGAEHTEPSSLDAFIVSLDITGSHRWSRQFGDEMDQEATSVCVDSSGNVIVAGVNSGNISLGGENIGPGIFVAKLDSDGNHMWIKGIVGSSEGDSRFIAGPPTVKSAPDGDLILAGHFTGTIQFDDTRLSTYPADAQDVYIARLDGETGSSRTADGGWVRRFESHGNETLAGIALHSSNNLVVTGSFTQRIEFDDISPTVDGGMFLVNLDRAGHVTWARGFANAHPTALSVDTLGNISATGAYEHPTNFGGGDLPDWSKKAFVVQFDIAGNHRWSRGFRGNITATGISTDTLDNVAVLTHVAYEARIDDGEILYVRDFPSPLVIKLDAEGRTLWRKWFPVEPFGAMTAGAIGAGLDGEIAISGRGTATTAQESTVDFGSGPQPVRDNSLFIAKLGM
ncbi:hypothetical protein [Sorangium sp. So ce854]|uniref:hypothetical protein n=1 Tax=Sorangium sp. So ce854 TaxID=3133322 RepID=UPI003F5FD91F